ncbi:MAG: Zn-dependent hydrolase [Gemmatimonadota bacterium]|nr:MAG: Zn-dependent hydrolase [Gemmatimonadota bacterium]
MMKSSVSEIEARMKKYALTPMELDLGGLEEGERALLGELLNAARLADEIFWRQTSHVAVPLREKLEAERPGDDPVRRFFMMQGGPYDRLDHDAAFMEGVPPKPPGAGFYPDDLTEEELHRWLDGHPEDREAFLSPYTVIRRTNGGLTAVPYHEAYAEFVVPLARSLRRAADLAANGSFARYLRAKADAVLTDEYFEADKAWIEMSSSRFDIIIGPFEVYKDELMNIKAAYEASVEIVDEEESGRLEVYKGYIADLEADLPYDDRFKPHKSELTTNFTIVRDIYRGGDLRVGYQAIACNLPNDPRVHTEVGDKKTFWKNMFEARVNKVILPISRALVSERLAEHATPQGFFNFVLLHEMAHGLGPRYSEVGGGRIPVNQALKAHYTWIEEHKADMAGLHGLAHLVELGVIDASLTVEHYASYLGGLFRTIRMGTGEAHGLAALVELNYMLENGGVTYDGASGRYAVDLDVLPANISELARQVLTIQATGDFAAAQGLKDRYGSKGPELEAALARVASVPVDPVPVYSIVW